MSDPTPYPTSTSTVTSTPTASTAPATANDQHLMVHGTPPDQPAPANLPETAPTATMAQPTEAVQSPAQTASDDPSANTATAVDQPHSEAGPQAVRPGDTQNVSPSVQAAQLEHTSSTTSEHGTTGPSNNCALAGGNFPQAPAQVPAPKPAKKSRRKKRDNHFSVRFTDDDIDILTRRMERTGESLSNAIRAIIRESESVGGNVTLTPKTPPEHLEKLLGALHKWRTAFVTAKPRLNIATPADDDARYEEVVAWRKKTDELLGEIPKLEEVVNAALGSLTSLTPARVVMLRGGVGYLHEWQQLLEKNDYQRAADMCRDLIDLLQDAGIVNLEAQ